MRSQRLGRSILGAGKLTITTTSCDMSLNPQAVDFSILAITLITLLTIQLRSFIIYASTATKALICLSIWIVPLCTSMCTASRLFRR